MKGKEIIKILTNAIPDSESWSRGEPYGAFNVDPEKDYKKVLYCVTPTREVQNYFKEHRYDLLISHHPFPTDLPQMIFHTALDCCNNGLNDMWKDALNIQNPKHFDKNLGWYGEIEPINYLALVEKVRMFCGGAIGQIYCNSDYFTAIKSVVVCAGLGGLVVDEALRSGADCYILGENTMPAEHTGFKAIIETGHTRSEWIGVKLFRDLLPNCIVDGARQIDDYFGTEIYKRKSFYT